MGKYKLYTYYLQSDTGFAPCYADGKFTLANCKPDIRRAISTVGIGRTNHATIFGLPA